MICEVNREETEVTDALWRLTVCGEIKYVVDDGLSSMTAQTWFRRRMRCGVLCANSLPREQSNVGNLPWEVPLPLPLCYDP